MDDAVCINCGQSSVESLVAQLSEAQEELAAWQQAARDFEEGVDVLTQERDEAIERGVCAIYYLESYFELVGLVRQQLIDEHDRAEAAETRAKQLEAEHQAMQDSAKPAARRTLLSGRQAR